MTNLRDALEQAGVSTNAPSRDAIGESAKSHEQTVDIIADNLAQLDSGLPDEEHVHPSINAERPQLVTDENAFSEVVDRIEKLVAGESSDEDVEQPQQEAVEYATAPDTVEDANEPEVAGSQELPSIEASDTPAPISAQQLNPIRKLRTAAISDDVVEAGYAQDIQTIDDIDEDDSSRPDVYETTEACEASIGDPLGIEYPMDPYSHDEDRLHDNADPTGLVADEADGASDGVVTTEDARTPEPNPDMEFDPHAIPGMSPGRAISVTTTDAVQIDDPVAVAESITGAYQPQDLDQIDHDRLDPESDEDPTEAPNYSYPDLEYPDLSELTADPSSAGIESKIRSALEATAMAASAIVTPAADDDLEGPPAAPTFIETTNLQPTSGIYPTPETDSDATQPDANGRDAGNSPSSGELATAALATNEFATDEFATDEFATNEFATDEFATDEFATDEFATDESTADGFGTDELVTSALVRDSDAADYDETTGSEQTAAATGPPPVAIKSTSGNSPTAFEEHLLQNLTRAPNAEEYQQLAHSILKAGDGPEPSTVCFISVESASHATEVVSHVGAVLSTVMNKRVLLVDASSCPDALTRVFRKDKQPGLKNMSSVNDDWLDMVLPTAVPNLFLLPCGWRRGSNTSWEIGQFAGLLPLFARQYDLTLIDAGVAERTEDTCFYSACDRTLMLARLGQTDRHMAHAVRKGLRNAKANLDGCIVTNLPA